MANYSDQPEALAEAISLLHILHRIPAPPCINPATSTKVANGDEYSLPFAKEQELVNALAFLVGNDDPNYVPALCVQEQPQAAGLNILLAVNQKDSKDADSLTALNQIQQRFNPLLEFLGHASHHTEQAILAKVVSVCSNRILIRLRYAKNKYGKSRQTIKHLLSTTSDLVGGKYKGYRLAARTTIKEVDNWAKYQTVESLCPVVESIYALSRITQLRPALDSIPNTKLGPSERRNLLRMILRVARYRETARVLYRITKKYPITRNMSLVLVTLPASAFPVGGPGYKPDLDTTSQRLNIGKLVTSNAATLSRLLIKNGKNIHGEFVYQAQRTLQKSKIHAEIQLVYYLETHAGSLQPRVIASSKMACYLCNLFLSDVAKIYTWSCHGRLYRAWRLPVFPPSCGMDLRFTKILEGKIRDELPRLVKSRKKTVFPDPSESALWTINESATTIAEPVNSVEESKVSDLAVEIQPCDADTADAPPADEAVPDLTAMTSSDDTVQPPSSYTRIKLYQGIPLHFVVQANSASPLHFGPSLLQIEYTIGPNSASLEMKCHAEWLTQEDAAAVRAGTTFITQAKDLEMGNEAKAENFGPLHIDFGGSLLRLVLS